ncbi:MAG TPA: ribosomal RNA small subunit methyltransferase A [Tissierellia bacterium]|nr:ribosomal RNA small subunit methyltransferase A [Tissierellia bacterium]
MNYDRTSPAWIKAKMDIKDLRFQKQWGQNFLIDGNVVENILSALDLTPEDTVVEIGPGLGALSERLIERVEHLVAVEIDRQLAHELARDFPRIEVITGDILKVDPTVFPRGAKVVGNLPYYITSAIIMHLLESAWDFDRLVIMMQKEVAERISASPGSKDYGVLSVITQLYCEVDYLFSVSRSCYMPSPKVDSAVVRLWPKPERDRSIVPVVKAAFSSRRKTIQNSLRNVYSPDKVSRALQRAGLEPTRRAETLSLGEFRQLAEAIDEA